MSFHLIYSLVFVQLLIVGFLDFKTHKISNYWIFINLGFAFIFHAFFDYLYPLSWGTFIFPLSFIGVGFFLYLLGIMGAGDSKFLASLFLVIPLEYHMVLFEKIVFSTLATGSIILFMKIIFHRRTLIAYLLSRHWSGVKNIIKSRFSYAPVITLAWILLGGDLWL